MRKPDSPRTLECIAQKYGYPRAYVEKVALLAGVEHFRLVFGLHTSSYDVMKDLGLTPLRFAMLAHRTELGFDFRHKLRIIKGTSYIKADAMDPETYDALLHEEVATAQREAVAEQYPHLSPADVEHTIGLTDGHASEVIKHYETHLPAMQESNLSLLAFAYLVSSLKGPLHQRMEIAPNLKAYANEQDMPLDVAIDMVNTTIQYGRKQRRSRAPDSRNHCYSSQRHPQASGSRNHHHSSAKPVSIDTISESGDIDDLESLASTSADPYQMYLNRTEEIAYAHRPSPIKGLDT